MIRHASQILELVRTANTEWQDHWSSRRRGLDKKQNELARIETVTTEFRFSLLSAITGLLATPEYVRASIADTPGDQSKTIAKKLERQSVLYDSSKSFTFLLTEQARSLSLAATSSHGNAARPTGFGISNSWCSARGHPLGGPHFGDAAEHFHGIRPATGHRETDTGALILRDHRDVNAYHEHFGRYESYAAFGDECRKLLNKWSETFTRPHE